MTKRTRRSIGDRAICDRCDLEIEWWPRRQGGWSDRGGQTTCNYQKGPDGELVNIEAKALKHRPYSDKGRD